jgi:hypothetical protein
MNQGKHFRINVASEYAFLNKSETAFITEVYFIAVNLTL